MNLSTGGFGLEMWERGFSSLFERFSKIAYTTVELMRIASLQLIFDLEIGCISLGCSSARSESDSIIGR